MTTGPRALNAELARALGIPGKTRKAVLTLEAGKAPRLELDMLVTDARGAPVFEPEPDAQPGETMAMRLARVRFMVRLERFPDDGATNEYHE